MIACACMGPKPGSQYCYCMLKSRGMDTSAYEWTEEEQQQLAKVLTEMCSPEPPKPID